MELRLAAPSMRRRLEALYAQLFSAYGPQGWWPLSSRSGKRSFDARGYHPGSSQRRYPFRCSQQFSPTANA